MQQQQQRRVDSVAFASASASASSPATLRRVLCIFSVPSKVGNTFYQADSVPSKVGNNLLSMRHIPHATTNERVLNSALLLLQLALT